MFSALQDKAMGILLCPLELHHCTYNQISLDESSETKVIQKASGFYLLDQRMADKIVKISL